MNTEERIKVAIDRGFTYNPDTGSIYGVKGNLIRRNNKDKYTQLMIMCDNKRYYFKAHHFAWYYTYGKMPSGDIDHINRIKSDNRISNLRDISHQKNCINRGVAKGYCWHKKNQKWVSHITYNNKREYLGCFDTEQEAQQVYLSAKKIYHKI